MKTTRLFFFISLLMFFSCSTKHQKTETNVPVVESVSQTPEALKPGVVIPSVTCISNPTNSYALYLPKNYSDSLKFPVMIFFDPHGSCEYPVGLFASLAEKFDFILMGSNNSKNGLQFEQTNAIVSSLVVEASSKFSIDKRMIALAGFSGGSKVALVGAASHPELGSVIFCGASVPFDNVRQLPPALGFAGVKDMNYTEVMSANTSLDQKKFPHCIIEWKGKHEWPDSLIFEDAFFW